MIHIIVATHGKFAEGMEDTINMFMGTPDNISFLSFHQGESSDSYAERFKQVFYGIKEDEIIVFNDILGGTPCKVAAEIALQSEKQVEIVGGLNLPMLMQCCILSQDSLSQIMDVIIKIGKDGVAKMDFYFLDEDD